MTLRTMLNRLLMLTAGLLAVAAPSYAHWGAISPWAFAGQSATCKHGSSTSLSYREVRVTTYHFYEETCEPSPFGGVICWPIINFFDSVARNRTPSGKSNSGKADVFWVGYDDAVPPGSFLPYIATINDLPRGAANERWFSSFIGKTFWNLQTACQTSDSML